jgi:hypothetical protein
MNEVKWSWKDVVEMVGVLGAIASLIFVAFQIRQNTRAIEALALGGRATPYRRPIFAELWEETKDDYSADFQDFVRRGILPMVETTCQPWRVSGSA